LVPVAAVADIASTKIGIPDNGSNHLLSSVVSLMNNGTLVRDEG